MRRHEREISDPAEIMAIMKAADVCRIAFRGDDYPYLAPVCFGFNEKSIYFHSSLKGKKIDLIKADNRVCFEVESEVSIVPGDPACKWTVEYRSVIGYGRAYFVEGRKEKIRALNIIMERYSGKTDHVYNDSVVDITGVIRVDIDSMTGKRSKD
jgi:hypothetical protein